MADYQDYDEVLEREELESIRWTRGTFVRLALLGLVMGVGYAVLFMVLAKSIRAAEAVGDADQRVWAPFFLFVASAALLGWVTGWYGEHRSVTALSAPALACLVASATGFGLTVLLCTPLPATTVYIYLGVALIMLITVVLREKVTE